MSDERRANRRLPVQVSRSWTRGARITDISLGGCYVDSRSVPPVGDVVDLELPTAEGPLPLAGTVVRGIPNTGFGVRFTPMDERTLDRLSAFLLTAKMRKV
jgi:hypothetical protein